MHLAAVDERIIGARLGRSLIDEWGRVWLREGVVLTDTIVRALRARGFSYVYLQPSLLPALPEDSDLPVHTRARAVQVAKETLAAIQARRPPDVKRLVSTVDEILTAVREDPGAVWSLSVLRSADDATFQHSVNVAVLSILIGIGMGYQREDLLTLGLSAILHDLGKALVPTAILTKPERLTAEEWEIMKSHTRLGFRVIEQDLPELPAHVAYVALRHHERMDGSGYPDGLVGSDLHPFALIVAVADVWDARTAVRPYKLGEDPADVAQSLLADRGRLFLEPAVRSLLLRVAWYPTGSWVRLKSGHFAWVVGQRRTFPPSPEILLVADAYHHFLPEPEPAFVDPDGGGRSVVAVLSEPPFDVTQAPWWPRVAARVSGTARDDRAASPGSS